jgi:hypothetical protein
LLSFLALNPNAPLILSTALLSVYYLRPYFTSRSMTSIFDHGIVWLEHRPALVLLIRQRWVSRKKTPPEWSFERKSCRWHGGAIRLPYPQVIRERISWDTPWLPMRIRHLSAP